MTRKLIKTLALVHSGVAILFVMLLLGIGHTILIESYRLLFAHRVTSISDLNSSFNVYGLSRPRSFEYTDVDFVFEVNGQEVRFNGYIAELSDGYFLIFTQQEVTQTTRLIMSPVTFAQENMELFKDTVLERIAQDSGLSKEQVSQLVHPVVFYDHTQRMINDIPVVIGWMILVGAGLWFAIKITKTYLQILFHVDMKHPSIWGRDKKRWILSTGIIQIGFNPVYVSYNDVLLYEKDEQGVSLKTKTTVFKVQGSEELYTAIMKKVVPDFVIKPKNEESSS